MNDHDKQNLEFLLNATPEVLQDWFDTMIAQGENDDIEYALELLSSARNQINNRLLEIQDDEAAQDVSCAAEYLQRFRLQ